MTREIDIRNTLRDKLKKSNARCSSSEALILDELGLCQGGARIDIAVINGALHGYEIKSAQDTLKRLPFQGEIYSRIFDTVTIVAPENHLNKVGDIVPEWWGLIEVRDGVERPLLKTVRKRASNPKIDPFALAQLLWRDEVLHILSSNGLDKGIRSKSNKILWRKLAESFSVKKLNEIVRHQLKTRKNWRADEVRI